MKLWLLTQKTESECWYGAYHGVVVAAPNEDTARRIPPGDRGFDGDTWAASPDGVTAECIGEARDGMPHGVVAAVCPD